MWRRSALAHWKVAKCDGVHSEQLLFRSQDFLGKIPKSNGKLIPLNQPGMTDMTNGEEATWSRHCPASPRRGQPCSSSLGNDWSYCVPLTSLHPWRGRLSAAWKQHNFVKASQEVAGCITGESGLLCSFDFFSVTFFVVLHGFSLRDFNAFPLWFVSNRMHCCRRVHHQHIIFWFLLHYCQLGFNKRYRPAVCGIVCLQV